MAYRIIHTDKFGGDYPDEKFVEGLPPMTRDHAELVANAINKHISEYSTRFWKAVPSDYKLQPGFIP